MTRIPSSLLEALDRWQGGGYPPQPRFLWRPATWERRFTRADASTLEGIDLAQAVGAVSEATQAAEDGRLHRIDRTIVTSLHAPEILMPGDGEHDARAVVTAFLAAMIWGYGTTGYGPYRTSRVLASDPDVVKHLIDVASRAQGSPNGGEDAFRHIAEHRGQADYLKYLGPAFGTKFLYFLTAASEVADTTPVMDAVVRRWFRSEADISLTTGSWDTESYQTYIGCLDEWREQMPTGRGGNRLERVDLELLIFSLRARAGTTSRGSSPTNPPLSTNCSSSCSPMSTPSQRRVAPRRAPNFSAGSATGWPRRPSRSERQILCALCRDRLLA